MCSRIVGHVTVASASREQKWNVHKYERGIRSNCTYLNQPLSSNHLYHSRSLGQSSGRMPSCEQLGTVLGRRNGGDWGSRAGALTGVDVCEKIGERGCEATTGILIY